MEVFVNRFYQLLVQIADEEEVYYEKLREEANCNKQYYRDFDKKDNLNRIDDYVLKNQFLELWMMYFYYLQESGRSIKDSDPIAMAYFTNIIVPIILVDSATSFEKGVEEFLKALIDLNFFEEALLIKYYAFNKMFIDVLAIMHSKLLMPIAMNVEGYHEFMIMHDPRG